MLLGVGVLGCAAGGGESSRDGGTEVIAAFYPLAYAADEIGGTEVEVTNLTPPGAEPHDVELSARDVERVRSADVVLYLGGGFQPALEDAVEGAEGRAVDLLEGLEIDDDPHAWLDPLRYAEMADRIGRALGRPGRAARFVAQLEALDQDYEAGLARCERREIVTSHAAFGYLAARYHLEQIAVTGLAPEAEPTARALDWVGEPV